MGFLLDYLFFIFLFLKIGIIPFHTWALGFACSLNYLDFFLFLTMFKLIPLFICYHTNFDIGIYLIILNILGRGILIFFYSEYLSILFFSSVFITSLLLMVCHLSRLFYFLVIFFSYIILSFIIIESLRGFKKTFLSDFYSIKLNLIFFLSVVSFVGLPFSLGFFMKIIFIQGVYRVVSNLFLFVTLIISAIIFSYHYIKIIHFYLIVPTSKYKINILDFVSSRKMNFTIFILCGFFFFLPLLFCSGLIFFIYSN